eukprot:872960-Rhodomonas_salina.1
MLPARHTRSPILTYAQAPRAYSIQYAIQCAVLTKGVVPALCGTEIAHACAAEEVSMVTLKVECVNLPSLVPAPLRPSYAISGTDRGIALRHMQYCVGYPPTVCPVLTLASDYACVPRCAVLG